MADKIFADGIRFERRPEKAPEWVKGKISFKVDDAIKFLTENKNDRGWVNLDLKQSKDGKLYLELNTFKKIRVDEGEVDPNEIPFG